MLGVADGEGGGGCLNVEVGGAGGGNGGDGGVVMVMVVLNG